MLRPGVVLGGRYRLDVFLASGGMGEVWRAMDVVLGRTVAVKVLLSQLLTDPGFSARFRAEARILAAFRHPNVVDVYDFGEADGAAYLVMAFVDGEPLSHRLAEVGQLPVPETMSVVAQAAAALHAAHTHGIVHRDVKPGNLIVQPDGTVVLVDFGVARAADMTAITAANAVPGTVLYMAPEQVSGKPVGPATDVYALGAVAYHCLAGAPPFTGEASLEVALKHLNDVPPPLPTDLPEAVRALVARTLAKDPGDRFATAAALGSAAALLGGLTGPGVASAVTHGSMRPATVAGVAGGVGTAVQTGVSATRADLSPVPDHPNVGTHAGVVPADRIGVPPARVDDDHGPPSGGDSRGLRRPAMLVALGAVLLATLGLIAVFAFTGQDDDKKAPAPGAPGSVAPGSAVPSRSAGTRPNSPGTSTTRPSATPQPGQTDPGGNPQPSADPPTTTTTTEPGTPPPSGDPGLTISIPAIP